MNPELEVDSSPTQTPSWFQLSLGLIVVLGPFTTIIYIPLSSLVGFLPPESPSVKSESLFCMNERRRCQRVNNILSGLENTAGPVDWSLQEASLC